MVINRSRFQVEQGWRTITHTFGHFACLLHPLGIDTCYDADFVEDTPIGQAVVPINCTDTVITCNNGPFGNMHQNFMWYGPSGCMNLFTEGQKDRMLNCIESQYPGLTDYQFLGVQDPSLNDLQVFPNPTNSELNFESPEKGNLSVFDLSGRVILSSNSIKGKNKLDVRALPEGIYLLQLQTAESVSSARFVKN
jgi:hypothetical protein